MQADFDVCWRCGTTRDGVEDPDFVTADETPPIVEQTDYLRLDAGKPVIDGDLPEPPLDLVACFHSKSLFEAKLLAEEIGGAGIPWTLENTWRLNGATEGFPCRIMIKAADAPRALPIIEEFEARQKALAHRKH